MKVIRSLVLAIIILQFAAIAGFASEQANLNYERVVEKVAGMTNDQQALAYAQKYELDIINLTWEDTARFEGSSVGPNISDMTIQVHHGSKEARQMTCMPVIRFPNYTDKATDNGVVSEEVIKSIREQIDRVYADGNYVGSLVVPEKEGVQRPIDWKPSKISF